MSEYRERTFDDDLVEANYRVDRVIGTATTQEFFLLDMFLARLGNNFTEEALDQVYEVYGGQIKTVLPITEYRNLKLDGLESARQGIRLAMRYYLTGHRETHIKVDDAS